MKFEIKSPCEFCPFRSDVAPFLDRRAGELARQLSDDRFWFACHMTTGVESGRRVRQADQSHCAGLMRVLWRERRQNIAMRLALFTGTITIADLERKRPPCFKSLDEFRRHHERKKIVRKSQTGRAGDRDRRTR